MFSFDPSIINIFLIVAVVALLALFITVLMKLNPSTETEEKLETEIEVERQKPAQTSPIAPSNPPPARIDDSRITEKPLMTVGPSIGGASVQVKQETPAPTLSQTREMPKPEKTVAPAKTETASSKRDCLHHFGYLRTLPKNAPIPDECFGCQKIVECLIRAKTR